MGVWQRCLEAVAGTTLGRMTVAREPIQVADVKETPAYRAGVEIAVKFVELGGARSYLAVPLLKDGKLLGAISIYRAVVRPSLTSRWSWSRRSGAKR